jgi:hypothetical protein
MAPVAPMALVAQVALMAQVTPRPVPRTFNLVKSKPLAHTLPENLVMAVMPACHLPAMGHR